MDMGYWATVVFDNRFFSISPWDGDDPSEVARLSKVNIILNDLTLPA